MSRARRLARFLLVDALATTVALALAVTFGVHLLFGWMPAQVEARLEVGMAEVTAPAPTDDPEERLRELMAAEIHTLWLRQGAWKRPGITRELLAASARRDLEAAVASATEAAQREGRGPVSSYLAWLGRFARGDLGTTRTGLPVIRELGEKAPLTLGLTLLAYLLAVTLGTLGALVRSAREGRAAVEAAHYLGYLLSTLPAFVLGYLLIAAGSVDPSTGAGLALALVTLVLSSGILAEVERQTHQSLREEVGADYAKTARVKGLTAGRILPLPGSIAFHLFRQASIHSLPRLATRVPLVLGMSVVVEKVFALQGLGDMLIDGLALRDEGRVLAVMVLAVVIVQLGVLLTRGAHLLLDPRSRTASGA